MKGDVHIHTNISDGSCSISEVLERAKERDLEVISITNHDTVRGVKEAIELGKRFGIKVIPGIEISAYDFETNKKVHILGYNFDLEADNINRLCMKVLQRRQENSLWQINILKENGYDITVEEVLEISKDSDVIYKQHIMKGLVNKGYDDKIYGDLYNKLYKDGGICNKSIKYIDALDAIRAIKRDKGISILAHPGQENNYDSIPRLLTAGLNGIELNHVSHSQADKEKIRDLSLEYAFILTGGSDYHGDYAENQVNIGDIKCPSYFLRFV